MGGGGANILELDFRRDQNQICIDCSHLEFAPSFLVLKRRGLLGLGGGGYNGEIQGGTHGGTQHSRGENQLVVQGETENNVRIRESIHGGENNTEKLQSSYTGEDSRAVKIIQR